MRAGMLTGLILLCAAFPTPLGADEKAADAKAKEHYATYRANKGKSYDAQWQRVKALRALAATRCARARSYLAKIARSGPTLDDRLVASTGVVSQDDLPSITSMLADLKQPEGLIVESLGGALAQSKNADILVWLAGEGLKAKGAAVDVVLRALAKAPAAESSDALIALYEAAKADANLVHRTFDIVQALGRGKSPTAVPTLLDAAKHRDARVRLAAADVLPLQPAGNDALDAAVRVLMDDADPVIRRSIVVPLGTEKAERFVPNLAARLEDRDLRARTAARDALRAISGKDFGFDPNGWRKWWEDRNTPNKPGTDTVPRYHDLPIYSQRLVFILDRSGSMRWPFAREVPTRMAVAIEELVRVLGALPTGTRFSVLSFDTKVYSWRKKESEAGPKTIAGAQKWVRRQESKKGQYTNTYGVLERALAENPDADCIYFLSDGIPEAGEVQSQQGILAAVRDWNRYRRIQMNVIALTLMHTHPGKYPITGGMRNAEAFMRKLAREGDGRFKHVDRPPKK